eukprot:gene19055-24877_t
MINADYRLSQLSQSSLSSAGSLISKDTFGSDLRLSCIHDEFGSNNRSIIGYTGKQSRKKSLNYYSRAIKPMIGYTGWYIGKGEGKLGKIGLHRSYLSTLEKDDYSLRLKLNKERYTEDELLNKYDPNRAYDYEVSLMEAESHGQDITTILKSIRDKLYFKYRSIVERRTKVKVLFSLCDEGGFGLCTEKDFAYCLQKLGIELPRPEYVAICAYLDEFGSGDIMYSTFIDSVAPLE